MPVWTACKGQLVHTQPVVRAVALRRQRLDHTAEALTCGALHADGTCTICLCVGGLQESLVSGAGIHQQAVLGLLGGELSSKPTIQGPLRALVRGGGADPWAVMTVLDAVDAFVWSYVDQPGETLGLDTPSVK